MEKRPCLACGHPTTSKAEHPLCGQCARYGVVADAPVGTTILVGTGPLASRKLRLVVAQMPKVNKADFLAAGRGTPRKMATSAAKGRRE